MAWQGIEGHDDVAARFAVAHLEPHLERAAGGDKGVIVLAAASGLLALIHRDVHAAAAVLIEHLHLNPASREPQVFIDFAAHLQNGRLALPGFKGCAPGNGVSRCPPVSVCHHVSTMGQRPLPMTR